jgi:hypothetical protein
LELPVFILQNLAEFAATLQLCQAGPARAAATSLASSFNNGENQLENTRCIVGAQSVWPIARLAILTTSVR